MLAIAERSQMVTSRNAQAEHIVRSSSRKRTVPGLAAAPVPTVNPKQLVGGSELVHGCIDERPLQAGLVGFDRVVPVAGRVGSRNPGASASAQRAAPQLPQTVGFQLYRSPGICRALSAGSRRIGRATNSHAGDSDPVASRWFPSLLALEITAPRWPAHDKGRGSAAYSRDEYREPALGSPADPWRTAQARHRCG